MLKRQNLKKFLKAYRENVLPQKRQFPKDWQYYTAMLELHNRRKKPFAAFFPQNTELYLCDKTKYFTPKLTKEDIQKPLNTFKTSITQWL